MLKFEELLKRWHDGELSGAEAGEFLGCSERQFRRWRRQEEDGLEGLLDRRLGKASTQRSSGANRGLQQLQRQNHKFPTIAAIRAK